MDLILWRHAEARDSSPDLERELTGKGHKQAEKMAAFLSVRLPEDVRVLASPARRTQQTARALTKHYVTEPVLAPGASAQAILDAIAWPDADGCVLVVGHQPSLGQVAALLLSNSDSGFSVKKGAVWWLSRHTREGDYQTNLRLVISPESV
ncbi:MAG: phosphohistidine phosphatase SixA [Pseudomonadota bacterium]